MAYQNKTQKTKVSAAQFINSLKDVEQKKDAKVLLSLFKEVTGEKPVMWGPAIIGFGKYAYTRKDGSAHEFLRSGFSPRKGNFSLYIMMGFDKYPELMKKLGTFKTGVGCLYIKKLSDVHVLTLKKLIKAGFKDMGKA